MIKQRVANLFLVGLAIALLVHFISIAICGEVILKEPSQTVLILEIIGMQTLIVFGIYNLLEFKRR